MVAVIPQHTGRGGLLVGVLLVDEQAEVGCDGVDEVHDLGQLVLVLHPRLLFQEEIELHGQPRLCGFELPHHEHHVGVHLRMMAQIVLYVAAVERHVHVVGPDVALLEVVLPDELVAQGFVNDADTAEIVVDAAVDAASLALLHADPVLERVVDECLRRHGDDGVVEIPNLHRCQCHLFHDAVGPRFVHRDPVAHVQHVVAGEPDAGYEALDGVLKHEHENSRCGTETSEQLDGVAVDDDADDDDSGYDEYDN